MNVFLSSDRCFPEKVRCGQLILGQSLLMAPHDGIQLRYVADDRVAVLEDPDRLVRRLDHGHLRCLLLHRGGYVDILFINAFNSIYLPVFLNHMPILAYPAPKGRLRNPELVADILLLATVEVLFYQVDFEFF